MAVDLSAAQISADPVPLVKIMPTYSDEARRARYEASCFLSVLVDTKGRPQKIRVVRPLGLGLDERAVAALERWRFRPATDDKTPVPKRMFIEMAFHLNGATTASIVYHLPPVYGDNWSIFFGRFWITATRK